MRTVASLIVVLTASLPAWAQPSPLAPSMTARPRVERHVVLEPVVGVWTHTFRDSDYQSKPGATYGFEFVIDPFRFMNVRAGVIQGKQPFSMPSSKLTDEARVFQPSLDFTRLHLRLEPTWHYSDRLSFYVGLGMGWSRFIADDPKASPTLYSFRRSGVYLGYEGALGVAFEPIVNWMVIDFSVAADYITNQSGSAFSASQAFTEDGHRTSLSGLSKFSAAYRAGLGIGIIL